MVIKNVIPETTAHIPDIDTLNFTARKYPINELKTAYTHARSIVIFKSFDIRYALAAGDIKNAIASIAPTDSNADTAVNDTNAIKL